MKLGFAVALGIFLAAAIVLADAPNCFKPSPYNITVIPAGITYLCPRQEYVTPGFKMAQNNATLDCQHSTIRSGGNIGVLVLNVTNINITNCKIQGFETGVLLNAPGRIIFQNTTLRENVFGIIMFMDPKKTYPSIYWNLRFMRNNISVSKMWLGETSGFFGELEEFVQGASRQSISIVPTKGLPTQEAFEVAAKAQQTPEQVAAATANAKSTRQRNIGVIAAIVVIVVFAIYWWSKHRVRYF